MGEKGKQVINGKAFEYALANEYLKYIRSIGLNAIFEDDSAKNIAKNFFEELDTESQRQFSTAAFATIGTIVKIEPGITAQKNAEDALHIRLAKDGEGQQGDVRDVIFSRPLSKWSIGFSAKNNNDAVKHSRLGKNLDFGQEWIGCGCSDSYWNAIKPVFDFLDREMQAYPEMTWKDMGDEKARRIYKPLLLAFKDELFKINEGNKDVPSKLISYLIGEHPFYKIIKHDASHMVVVKAFNIKRGLNKTVNGKQSRYKVAPLNLPTRIVEFEFKSNSDNTLVMILDQGWEISFRIHSASTKLERSLKFDVQLLGNPPVLFSQYLFQEM